MSSLNKKMGDAHEQRMVEALGGRMTRGSGNQSHDQMDGKHTPMEVRFAFAWDGKSTRGESVGVSRAMWAKAVEQAQDRRPMLGLCFYDNDRLTEFTDLVVLTMDDLAELLDAAESASLDFDAWLAEGIAKGYCSEPVCNTHDGLPSTAEEDEEWERGGDPCVSAVRLL